MKYRAVFYNVGPFGKDGRGHDDLNRELKAIASQSPEVIAGCEFVGWGDLPNLPGYTLVRSRDDDSVANIAAYVRSNLDLHSSWHLMTKTWKRTEHPGLHAPRAILELHIEDTLWFITHQAPRTKFHDTTPAKEEVIEYLTPRMAPWLKENWEDRSEASRQRAKDRLRVVLWDPNHDPAADGPGPKMLARRCLGTEAGTPIEGAVARGGSFRHPRKQATVAGVRLGSDHHGAFFTTLVNQ